MLRLSLTPYTLFFAKPAATSRGDLAQREILLVRAWDTETPEVVGWGECGPIPGLSPDASPEFAEVAAEVCAVINAGYMPLPADLAELPSLAFGLEMAQRDLAGGGTHVLWDTPFSRGEAGLPTHGLIWMDTPDGLLRQIEGGGTAGFRVIKMKVGALPLAEELHLLATVRSAFGPAQVELRLDANGAFAPDTVLATLEQFAAFDVAYLEQPIPAGHWSIMAGLCRRSPIPLALDEELIAVTGADCRRRLLDTILPQHLILKPALLGGFAAAGDWIADAEARGIQWWTNSLLESNLGLNAICQWTAAVDGSASGVHLPSGRIHGLGTGGLFTNNFPAPVRLAGNQLIWDTDRTWKLPSPQTR
jgi:o-succinylbenzoate synthase